jgi:hypothetical protein
MTNEFNLSSSLNRIFNSFGIIYSYEGYEIPVKFGRLENEGELNAKVVTRIYIELIGPDGTTNNAIFGLITKPVNNAELIGLTLVEEFESLNGKRQIWINDKALPYVRVTVPSKVANLIYEDPKDLSGGE